MKPASAKSGLQEASQPISEIYSVIGLADRCSLFAKRSSDGPETRPNNASSGDRETAARASLLPELRHNQS